MSSHGKRPGRGTAPGGNEEARPRVLIVDDNASMRAQIGQLLEEEFTVAGLVGDIESLIGAWPVSRPDVIVLDIAMPRGTGFEAAGRLRAAGCHVPIVFASVYDAPEIVRAAWEAGGTAYVAKGDLVSALATAVRSALRGRRFVSASIDSP